MTWFTGVVVYLLIWWVALFAVLPIGAQPNPEGDDQTGWRGVPQRPQLLRKVVITTLVSAILWLAIFAVVESDWMSFRSGWWAMPND